MTVDIIVILILMHYFCSGSKTGVDDNRNNSDSADSPPPHFHEKEQFRNKVRQLFITSKLNVRILLFRKWIINRRYVEELFIS